MHEACGSMESMDFLSPFTFPSCAIPRQRVTNPLANLLYLDADKEILSDALLKMMRREERRRKTRSAESGSSANFSPFVVTSVTSPFLFIQHNSAITTPVTTFYRIKYHTGESPHRGGGAAFLSDFI